MRRTFAFAASSLAVGRFQSITLNAGNPVLSPFGSGDEPGVIKSNFVWENPNDTNEWILGYFTGTTNDRLGIKIAKSTKADPHTWTKQTGFILERDLAEWDYSIGSASLPITDDSGNVTVVYCNHDTGKVGIATTTDGDLFNLVKNPANPVIDNSATSDFNKFVRHPYCIRVGDTVHMFYDARASRNTSTSKVAHATADISDLTTWTLDPEPIIDVSVHPAMQNTPNPSVIELDGVYHLFFSLTNTGSLGTGTQGGGIGYMTSTDLINWEVVTSSYWLNYLFEPFNEWGDSSIQEFTPFFDGTPYLYMYEEDGSIGYATLNPGVFNDVFPLPVQTDDFAGAVIDTGKWTITEQNGITVTQNDKLDIIADGAQTDASFPQVVVGSDGVNVQDYITASFYLSRTPQIASGPDFFIGLKDSAGTTFFGIQKSEATNEFESVLTVNGVNLFTDPYGYGNGVAVKLVVAGDRVYWWRLDTGENDWVIVSQYKIQDNNWANKVLNFTVNQNNLSGSARTLTLEKFTLNNEDYPGISNYSFVSPVLLNGLIEDTAKSTVNLTFDNVVVFSDPTGWVIELDGVPATITALTGSQTRNVVATISETVTEGAIVTVSYSGSGTKDYWGNDLPAIVDQQISNRVGPYSDIVFDVLDQMTVKTLLAERQAIEAFVDGCETDGNWPLISEFFGNKLQNDTNARTGFKGRTVETGGTHTPGVGISYTGTDFANSNYIPSVEQDLYVMGNALCGAFIETVDGPVDDFDAVLSTVTAVTNERVQLNKNGANLDNRIMNISGGSKNTASNTAFSDDTLYVSTRVPSTLTSLYIDGVLIDSDSFPAGNVTSESLKFCGYPSGGYLEATLSSKVIGAGEGFDHAAFNTRLRTFNTSLGSI